MPKNFKPVYIPIIFSILIFATDICVACKLIHDAIPNGFSSGGYWMDGSDLAPMVRLLSGLFCIAFFVVAGMRACLGSAVVWGVYGMILIVRCFVREYGKRKNRVLMEDVDNPDAFDSPDNSDSPE